MNTCVKAADASTRFERLNNDLKRRYLIRNIDTINSIMSRMPGYKGSFGTGYPFYVLDENLQGSLPVIDEQIRYNDELVQEACGLDCWQCEDCLSTRGTRMPDLKMICKPCPQIKDSIKPRKVINRLPDVDMWMICEDGKVEEAKKRLVQVFDSFDMHTSDVDPVKTINEVLAENNTTLDYKFGTMIEVPRGALTAAEIAEVAEFFSFGTNDLTQMTFGFSRDDAGKFLEEYYARKVFENDPFAHIDQNGVGKLMQFAVEGGRSVRPNIKLGICGEHGGDPDSIEFCHNLGLDYVSCSPFRVPIARLAAAHANIKNPRK